MANNGSFSTSSCDGKKLVFNWSLKSQSTSGNYSVINYSLTGSGGSGWTYMRNGYLNIYGARRWTQSGELQLRNGTVVTSGTLTIYHNSNGDASFGADAGAGIYVVAVNCTGSGSWSLPHINRYATITGADDFNDETNPSITYSNPAGNNVSSLQACISLTGATDDIPYREISKTGTSYTFELTDEERNILRQATPNNNTLNVKFYVKTIISGTNFYSSLTKKMTIVNANPTFSDYNYQDINETTINLTGDSSKIVKNYSTIKVSIANTNKAIPNKYSTMKNYIANNVSADYSDTDDVTFSIPKYSASTLLVNAVDSRGNTTGVSKELDLIDYNDIEITTTPIAKRTNDVGDESEISLSGTFWNSNFGVVNNVLEIKYKYREAGSTEGFVEGSTALTPTISENGFTISNQSILGDTNLGFDSNKSYEILITIADKLSSYNILITLQAGIPAMALYGNKIALGNKYDESLGGNVQLWGEVKLNGEDAGKTNYSKTEQVIGKWVDGKAIYRKVYIQTSNTTINVADLNIDTMVNMYGICNETSLEILNATAGWTENKFILLQKKGNLLYINLKNLTINYIHIILEYTKTTDTGGNS